MSLNSSSSNFNQLTPASVGLETNITQGQINTMASIDAINVGKITKFNPQTCTADIQLLQVREYMGLLYEPPILSGIPLLILGGMNSSITFPENDLIGATCLLCACDRNISSFLTTGEIYKPQTSHMHNITDSIAITSIRTLNNPLPSYDPEALSIVNNITVQEETPATGKVHIALNQLTVQAGQAPTVTPIAQIDLNASGLIGIQNSSTSLLTVLTDLITACKNITDTRGDTLNPDSQTAFDNVQQTLNTLLS